MHPRPRFWPGLLKAVAIYCIASLAAAVLALSNELLGRAVALASTLAFLAAVLYRVSEGVVWRRAKPGAHGKQAAVRDRLDELLRLTRAAKGPGGLQKTRELCAVARKAFMDRLYLSVGLHPDPKGYDKPLPEPVLERVRDDDVLKLLSGELYDLKDLLRALRKVEGGLASWT